MHQSTGLSGNFNTARHVVHAYPTATHMMIYSKNASSRPEQFTPPSLRLRYTLCDYNM